MNVRLPLGVPERIDAVVGKRRRAKFIRDAVVTELEKREAAAENGQTDTALAPLPVCEKP